MDLVTKKPVVRYKLKSFLKVWEVPEMDFLYDLPEDSDYGECGHHVGNVLKEEFLREFWNWYGEEIGEYDLWKDYINKFFLKNIEKYVPLINQIVEEYFWNSTGEYV